MKSDLRLVLPVLLALVFCAGIRSAMAQAQVAFVNYTSNRVFNCVNGAPLTNNGRFQAALYYAPDGVTDETAFIQVGANATINPPGIYNGGNRVLPAPAGKAFMFQVRVWEVAYGSTWEGAFASGPINCRRASIGKSAIVRVITTAFPDPAAPLNMPSFYVCPTPCVTVTCPPNITIVTNNPSGVAVTYTATGTNLCCPPTNSVSCSPPSGSTFPVGTTFVNCIVTDGVGPSNTCNFLVIIRNPDTHYVSLTASHTAPYTSWATAATNVQSAVNVAADGDTVLVTNGTYRLSTHVVIPKAINVRSVNGAGLTILDGQNSTRCLYGSNSLAVIDGFTIRNGRVGDDGGGIYLLGGVVQNCIVSNCVAQPVRRRGGGIFMIGGLLRDSLIIDNHAFDADGGGVYCPANGRVERCVFRGNSTTYSGGGVYLQDSVLTDSWITGCSANDAAGGVFARRSTVSNCVISNNVVSGSSYPHAWGGGVYLHGGELDRCLVLRNMAGLGLSGDGYGGGIFCISNATVRNTLIASNQAVSSFSFASGGGVYLLGSDLYNCTVTANSSDQGAGGIDVQDGAVWNTISYFNAALFNENWGGSGFFNSSCTTPHPGGINNITADPQFINAGGPNYRLMLSSPCINTGTNLGWMFSATDLDGNPRISNNRADIGAYEAACLPPLVTLQPVAQTNCSFEVAGFSVVTSGSHPQSYQWQRGGVNLTNDARFGGVTSSSLVISNVQPADAGNYRVVVTNACGGTTSTVASLTVRSLPAIGLNPLSRTVCEGSLVFFSATASGSDPKTYRWQKDGVNLTNGIGVNGVTTTNLLLLNVSPGDEGNYRLFVSNSCGVTNSFVASLTVWTPPVVTGPFRTISTNVGASVSFNALVPGATPRSFQWRLQGVNLTNGGRISGATSSFLSIVNAQPEDSGTYSVVVSNACGSVTNARGTLTVADCPQLTLQPLGDSLCVGSTASFRVAATGTGPFFISWYRNGELLENDGRISGASSTNLVISNADIYDAGTYDVLISNACGSTNSIPVELVVLTPPEITLQPQNKVAYEGETVSFSSAAISNLTNYYRWHLNGLALPGADTPMLVISNVTKAHAGDYTVIISNSCAAITSAVATLAVPDCLLIAADPISQEVTAGSSAAFSVTASGGPILSYRWRYNDAELNDSVLISGSYTPQLQIASVGSNHVGYYSVVISNFCGFITSAPAVLTLTKPFVAETAPPSIGDLKLSRAGTLQAVVVQPDGRIIVGGFFSSINGVPRNNLARLNPDGSVDGTWDAGIVGGEVRALALALDGTNLFVGGDFTKIGGQFRNGLAKLSTENNGAADGLWDPNVSSIGTVQAIAVFSTNVFIGGSFEGVGGVVRQGLAKLNGAGTGAPDVLWRADVGGGSVSCLAAAGGSLYVGGVFSSVRGEARANLARVAVGGGGLVDAGWMPEPNGAVSALAVQGFELFVGGQFSTIGGTYRSGLAKFQIGTGVLDEQWNPMAQTGVYSLGLRGTNLYVGAVASLLKIRTTGTGEQDVLWRPDLLWDTYPPVIEAIVAVTSGVFAGGMLTDASGTVAAGMAKLNEFNGARVSSFGVQLELPGTVYAMGRQPDGKVILGGDFLFAGGLVRRNLARLNVDGTVDGAWLPSAYGAVEAIGLNGGSAFVGGWFERIGTNNLRYLAKVNTAGSDAVDANWRPLLDGGVHSLAVAGTDIFVGGQFQEVNGWTRRGVCKLSSSGVGMLDTNWNANLFEADLRVFAYALELDDDDLYVGGKFASAGGVPLANLARVSSSGGGLVDGSWRPNPDGEVRALELAGTNLYVGGAFTLIGGQVRRHVGRVSVQGNGAADSWAPQVNDMVRALATAGTHVYVGGGFGGESPEFLLKLDGNGEADPAWKHRITDDPDSRTFYAPGVWALLAHGSDLHVGGHFTHVDGVSRVGYVFLAVPDAPTIFVGTNWTIVLQRNAADGPEVTHFLITEIVGGNLFGSDGVTPIKEGDFVTVAEGERGLKFVGTIPQPRVQSVTAVSAFGPTPASTGTEGTTVDISVGGLPAFSFSRDRYEVSEGVDPALVEVTVVKRNLGAASVSFVWEPVSAHPYRYHQGDFLPLGTIATFYFGAEQTTTNIEFFIYNDDVREGDEHFRVTLVGNSAGSQIVLPVEALVTIVDDECTGEQGSQMQTNMAAALPPLTGGLRLRLNPGNGQWRLPGDPVWRNSESTANGLAAGVYEVMFRPLQYGGTLLGMSFQVKEGEITAPPQIDYPDASPPGIGEGGLTVLILPEAIAASASWKIAGGSEWLASGTRAALNAGTYLLEFSAAGSWQPPPDVFATVGAGLESTRQVYFGPAGAGVGSGLAPVRVSFAEVQREPYHYNGLIETEVPSESGSQIRFGSGVVVKERVVLTAAHVLFDDRNLTYVTRARWYLQKHMGDHEARPQSPQGWYIRAGYDHQRQKDNSPDVATPESQAMDIAAMFFIGADNQPGRGGYGGFVASDSDANEWLHSTRPKMLVGYPLNPNNSAQHGQLHATPQTNASFQQLYPDKRVYANEALQSFPGNSGGPLYVQADDGHFYPAAVYLGGYSRVLVRAIDKDAVCLINSAEQSSHGGGHHVGGGVALWDIGDNQKIYDPGLFGVFIEPAAIKDIAGWRVKRRRTDGSVDRSDYYKSGEFVYPTENGEFIVEFQRVTGWGTPTNRIGLAQINHIIRATNQYVPLLMTNPTRLNAGAFQFFVQGITGRAYIIEAATDLPNFAPLDIVTNDTGTAAFIDALQPPTRRFYRLMEQRNHPGDPQPTPR
jgi:hypothetical protein